MLKSLKFFAVYVGIMKMSRMSLALVVILLSVNSYAKIKIPLLITDGVVIQRGKTIPIWGWAGANEKVTIKFDGKARVVTSSADGNWEVNFPAKSAGGPYQLNIKGNDSSITVNDVWIGDVWVLSGQSNMEWPLRNVNNADMEIANATDGKIRHFKIPNSWAIEPELTLAGGSWSPASPKTVGAFSGIGYFFAKNLRNKMDVPIGLIGSNWGGSNIESWMEASLLGLTQKQASENIKKLVVVEKENLKAAIKNINQWPGALVENVKRDQKTENSNSDLSAAVLDESDWDNIKAPSLWESEGFGGMDGIAWYRKSFTLNQADIAQDLILNLAKIDDNDITWVNGVKVGETNAYDKVRRYVVPKKLLKAGKNIIAIRVDDTGGGGGIYSNPAQLYIDVSGKKISLAGLWKFKVAQGKISSSANMNHTSTALYNKMMHPLFKTPVKGVLWYQGESNANNPQQAYDYRYQFISLIKDWRTQWQDEQLPFLWVQLANFNSGQNTETNSPWAIVRDSQAQALSLPNTGQVLTIDVGNPDNIHPRDKQTVGRRLALEAFNKIYGMKDVKFRGPFLANYSLKQNKVELTMQSNSRLKLSSSENEVVNGFLLAGENKEFFPAMAKLDGEKIVVWSDSVKQPVAIRYAWDDNPENLNLFDTEGLPAEPFRTDKWLEEEFEK